MALKCAHCRSLDTQVLADKYQCIMCGGSTGFDGQAHRKVRGSEVVMTDTAVES